MKYNLIDYFDVWGNDVEGYEVNNLCKTDIYINIEEEDNDVDILVKLVESGYFLPNAVKKVEVEWLEESYIEFYEKNNYMPLCRLEKREEE